MRHLEQLLEFGTFGHFGPLCGVDRVQRVLGHCLAHGAQVAAGLDLRQEVGFEAVVPVPLPVDLVAVALALKHNQVRVELARQFEVAGVAGQLVAHVHLLLEIDSQTQQFARNFLLDRVVGAGLLVVAGVLLACDVHQFLRNDILEFFR